jgi:hypothetical protein
MELLKLLSINILDALFVCNANDIFLRSLSPNTIIVENDSCSIRFLILPTVIQPSLDNEFINSSNEAYYDYKANVENQPFISACIPPLVKTDEITSNYNDEKYS